MRQIAIFFIDGIINTASEKIHPRNWEVDDCDFEVDSGNVVGLAGSKRLLEEIPNKIHSKLGMTVQVLLLEDQGKHWLRIIVPSLISDPINYNGRFYRWVGSSRQELTGQGLARFMLRKM